MKKTVPIGISSFEEIVQKHYYVDKTRFIADLMDDDGAKVTLCTRPRRFGKTLVLSMLKYFFSMENAEKNRALFKDLAISRMGKKYMDLQGSAPVISITLKDIIWQEYPKFLKYLSCYMADIFDSYRYILDSDACTQSMKQNFSMIQNNTADEVELSRSLYILSKCFCRYYNKKTVILIDEYDTPVISAWENGYYPECIAFMKVFLGSSLKDSEYFSSAVLTGITQISKESIFSGLNSFSVNTVLSAQYSDIFGFTDDEIRDILRYYDMTDAYHELQEWYDGYLFGKKEIYNPWSVLNYIRERMSGESFSRMFWINTSGNAIITHLLKKTDAQTRSSVEALLLGKTIQSTIEETFVYDEIERTPSALFSLLVASGYLKVTQTTVQNGQMFCDITIPNKEVFTAYRRMIFRNLSDTSETSDIQLNDILNAMIQGNTDMFQDSLQKFLERIVSHFDVTKTLQESFYHGLILGFVAVLEDTYTIQSNKESGYGRFDIACIPKKDSHPGILLEFKSSAARRYLKRDARKAMDQIRNRRYDTVFPDTSTNTCIYGIAFFQKYLCIQKG